MYNKANCKLCGSDDKSLYSYGNHKNKLNLRLLKLSVARLFPGLTQLFRPNIDIDNLLLFCPLNKISVCKTCGYGVYERVITRKMLEKYYDNVYWASDGLDKEKYFNNDLLFLKDNRANGQYKIVKDYLPRNKSISILEIGAGAALFSRLIHYYYPQTSIDVVEPGYGWKEYYEVCNIKKAADFFPFTNSKKNNYIHTSHWLEHVIPDIEKITGTLNKLLFPGGLLFVEVPNCNSEYWDSESGDIPHIHFFTENSLTLLFEQADFELLKIGTYGETVKENLDYFHPATKRKEPNKSLVLEVGKSIRESIPRKNGSSLRAVFQKNG